MSSRPTQKGQCSPRMISACSTRKSFGRLRRSVEMITQRPVTGSLRSSGTGRIRSQKSASLKSKVKVKSQSHKFEGDTSRGRIEGILIHIDHRLPFVNLNGHDIK